MSVDSENKSNKMETMALYTSSEEEPENGFDSETLPEFSEDINFTTEVTPVTPEFVLRLPTITNGMFDLFLLVLLLCKIVTPSTLSFSNLFFLHNELLLYVDNNNFRLSLLPGGQRLQNRFYKVPD